VWWGTSRAPTLAELALHPTHEFGNDFGVSRCSDGLHRAYGSAKGLAQRRPFGLWQRWTADTWHGRGMKTWE